MTLPMAESCLRNQQPILEILSGYLGSGPRHCLELGSGTGQHAVYFAQHQAQWRWQPSDTQVQLAGIELWRQHCQLENLLPALELDADNAAQRDKLKPDYDAVFMANTIHFVKQQTALNLLRTAQRALQPSMQLFIYGPFNDDGKFTSEGNRQLDLWLKARDAQSGIRDEQWLYAHAERLQFRVSNKHLMPANNLMLVFEKMPAGN